MKLRTALPAVALSLASVVPALGPVIQQCSPPPVTYAGQLPANDWVDRWIETVSNAFKNAWGQLVPGPLRPANIIVTRDGARSSEVHSCWLYTEMPGTAGGDLKLVPLDTFWRGKEALYNEQCVQPIRKARAAGRNVAIPVAVSYEGADLVISKNRIYRPIQMTTPVSGVAGFAQGRGIPAWTVNTDAAIVNAYFLVIPTF